MVATKRLATCQKQNRVNGIGLDDKVTLHRVHWRSRARKDPPTRTLVTRSRETRAPLVTPPHQRTDCWTEPNRSVAHSLLADEWTRPELKVAAKAWLNLPTWRPGQNERKQRSWYRCFDSLQCCRRPWMHATTHPTRTHRPTVALVVQSVTKRLSAALPWLHTPLFTLEQGSAHMLVLVPRPYLFPFHLFASLTQTSHKFESQRFNWSDKTAR